MTGRRRASAIAAAVLGGLLLALGWPLPEAWFKPTASRTVLDRHGAILAERANPERGRASWVELDEVAPHLLAALLASEDQRFYAHPGVDPLALGRALIADLRAGAVVQGGSTLTMQTARVLSPRPPGLFGKLVELFRAVRLDAHLDKDEILTWYVNRASFGPGTIGIQAAAERTFDEDASSLSLSEAALLVGALPAPARLHPSVDLEAAASARDRVLARMLALGSISPEEAARAQREPIELRRPPARGDAPHLAAHLLDQRPETTLRTTLDVGIQREVEALVRARLDLLAGREVDHAAVLVAELMEEGPVMRAWVGSGDWSSPDGENDGVRMRRSPGSTLKPFLFAMALEDGWRTTDVLPDLPVSYTTTHGSWAPRNYDDRFSGPMSLRTALATSANVPAVRLLDEVGVASLQERLVAMGLPLHGSTSSYGLGLVLGGGEVSLFDLVGAYAALAQGGEWRPLRLTEDESRTEPTPIFSPMAAWGVSDILSDPVARAPAFGRYSTLARGYHAAAKTGTSTGFRDNWTVGYTDRWVVGTWVGNFDGRPMGDVSGITGAGPIWAEVMDLVTGREASPPEPPGAVTLRRTCALSGGTPGAHCPQTHETLHPAEHPAPEPCTWHDTCGVRWPAEYLPWATASNRLGDCHGYGGGAIAWPTPGSVLYIDPTLPPEVQRVPLRAAAGAGSRATWRVDGSIVAAVPATEAALWTPERSGEHTIALDLDGADAGSVRITVGGVTPGGD